MRFLPALTLAAFALFSPARAAEDAATGLAVNLPAEFAIEQPETFHPYAAIFGVKFATGEPSALPGEPFLCQVTFENVAGNADMTVERINALIGSPEWLAIARPGMETLITIASDASFELHGYKGHEFIGTPKKSGGENVRLVLSLVETAKGRTSISCVTDAARLDEMLPAFHAIRDGVTPPV